MSSYQTFADKALRDEALTRDEALSILSATDDDLLQLLDAAFQVRRRYFGRKVRLQMLLNAKSGACQEDCHYCSQSSVSTAPIDRYGLLPLQAMFEGARRAADSKAQRYCIVISGRAPLDREITDIAAAVSEIKKAYPIQICCSLGLLDQDQARRLKASGVDRINHNLNTSESYHPSICTTHSYQDRVTTIQAARSAGLEICSGGIVGMGERDQDLVDLSFGLRELKPDSIPLNTLHPASGTPLEQCHELTPTRCLKILCMFRFLHPRTELRVAGGREHNLRWLQPLALYPADSVFVNGYLTTPGQPAPDVWKMVEDLGFEIEVQSQSAAAPVC
ncbi:biotin synthase [Nitrospira sp.]|nr:biotin synthase [Nitrospira sp.]